MVAPEAGAGPEAIAGEAPIPENSSPPPGDVRRVSRRIRKALLPRNAPKVEGYDIAAGTSLEEDGDGRSLWDVVRLKGGRTAILSLVVRREGLPQAVHLAVARSLVRALAPGAEELTEVLRRVNDGMADAGLEDTDQFVECGVLVPSSDRIVWAAAGRSPAAVLRRDGNFEELPSHGPPLGVMGGFRYGTYGTEMRSGDVALVLSEASTGLFRGAADLVATLQGRPAGEVVSTVHRALRKTEEAAVPETTVLYVRKQ